MSVNKDRTISSLNNGLKIFGKQNADGSIDLIQDKDGNVLVGLNAAGLLTGSIRNAVAAAVTATVDGLTTGLIALGTTFVTVTSSVATKFVTLPAASAATIGQTIRISVGANGYALVTPASSNNTINTVDADGTNQLDVAANSLLTCVQVSATGWMVAQQTATTITVVAPDND